MLSGLESFRRWFEGCEEQYVIIGGTACDLLFSGFNMEFRATKDIDMVLIVESMTPGFGERFWGYIKAGGYVHRNKSTGKQQFYRFDEPGEAGFPAMIELFTRKPDALFLPEDAVLTPLHVSDEISSLSAIMLDGDYYSFIIEGKTLVEGIQILDAAYLIPLKIKAWLDLSARKATGEQVDSKDIRKHRNDVFRLYMLLGPETRVLVSDPIARDIADFIAEMKSEPVDLKALGIRAGKEQIIEAISEVYLKQT